MTWPDSSAKPSFHVPLTRCDCLLKGMEPQHVINGRPAVVSNPNTNHKIRSSSRRYGSGSTLHVGSLLPKSTGPDGSGAFDVLQKLFVGTAAEALLITVYSVFHEREKVQELGHLVQSHKARSRVVEFVGDIPLSIRPG